VEHVLPQMFGSYEPDNLVLNDVCGACNNDFSKLEQALGRDTPEALQRIVHGLKPFSAASELENRRATYFVDRPGPWYGARVILAGDHEMYPVFLPQAAFQLSEGAPWEWLLEEKITASGIEPYLGKRYRVKVTGDSESEIERLREKLESFGVIFSDAHSLEVPTGDDGRLELGIQAVIDDIVLRAITKIAFNYLAYIAGASFVLAHDFDTVRQYIRAGEPGNWSPVSLRRHQLVLRDASHSQPTVHSLELGWSEDGTSPVAHVTFFNGNTYRVTFTWNYHGIWRPLRIGHHFDMQTRRIRVSPQLGIAPDVPRHGR
jgi:hypothetical protein